MKVLRLVQGLRYGDCCEGSTCSHAVLAKVADVVLDLLAKGEQLGTDVLLVFEVLAEEEFSVTVFSARLHSSLFRLTFRRSLLVHA